MGLRKKIKKAVKKVTKVVTKPVKKVVKAAEKVIKKPLEAVGIKEPKAPKVPEAVDAPPNAVQVDVAGEDAKPEVEGGSESDKRKTQSRGKGKLTVARKSGRGLNI